MQKWGKAFSRHPVGSGPYMLDEVGRRARAPRWCARTPTGPAPGIQWVDGRSSSSPPIRARPSYSSSAAGRRPRRRIPRPTTRGSCRTRPGASPPSTGPGDRRVLRVPERAARSRSPTSRCGRPSTTRSTGRASRSSSRARPVARPDLSRRACRATKPDAHYYPYDPAKAKQLLAEAGFPNGFKVTFVSHNVDPMPKLAQAVQNDLRAVGIDASIKLMDKATYWDYISPVGSHMRPIGLTDWFMDFPDPSDFIGLLYTHPSEGSANANFYTKPAGRGALQGVQHGARPGQAHRRCSCRCRTSSWPTRRPQSCTSPCSTGCTARTSAATTTTRSGNLQYQEMWKLDGK